MTLIPKKIYWFIWLFIFNGRQYSIFKSCLKKRWVWIIIIFFLVFCDLKKKIIEWWVWFLFCFRVIIHPERAQVQVITPHGPSILRMGIISTANLPRSMKADPEPLDRTSMLTSSLPPSPPSTMVCITRPGGRTKTWGQGRGPDTQRIGWNGLMHWTNGFQNR